MKLFHQVQKTANEQSGTPEPIKDANWWERMRRKVIADDNPAAAQKAELDAEQKAELERQRKMYAAERMLSEMIEGKNSFTPFGGTGL